jgi:YHS domain-containing protein
VKDMSDKATDPVCGMEVDKDNALKSRSGKNDYYFCSVSCKVKFELSSIRQSEHKKED